jgi:hypothetical protein
MSDPPLLLSPLSFISQEGKTALDWARERNKNECAKVLERHFDREVSRSQHPSLANPTLPSLHFPSLSSFLGLSPVINDNRRDRERSRLLSRESEKKHWQPPCPPLRSKRRSAKPFLLSCLRLTSLSLSFPSQEAEILSLRSELSSARSQLSALDLKLKSSEREVEQLKKLSLELEDKVPLADVLVAREVSCPIFKINKEGRYHSSESNGN